MSHVHQLHNRRYFDDYMEIINRKGLPGNVKSEICQQVNDAVVATTQHVIEQALEGLVSRGWLSLHETSAVRGYALTADARLLSQIQAILEIP